MDAPVDYKPRTVPAPFGIAGLEGKFYATRGIPENAWYLHQDGRWLQSTKNEAGEFTGYFDSQEAAERMLKLHS